MKPADDLTNFLKTFQILAYSNSKWEVWNDFIFMTACAFSNSADKANYEKREREYLAAIHKYKECDQKLFPVLLAKLIMAINNNPRQDFLGTAYLQLGLGNSQKGQFFTPYSICELMARITMGDPTEQIRRKGYISVNDSACGAGATLIAAANYMRELLSPEHMDFKNHFLATAQDIDKTVGLMCYIQLSLLGVAGYVKIGDSLSNPICDGDDLPDYWFTPKYFSNVWKVRRTLSGKQILC